MLVLSRREGQAVWIGDTRVIVQKIYRDGVQLLFDAPPEVKILREELVLRDYAAASASLPADSQPPGTST